MLDLAGNTVNMIGSQKSGTMADNSNEGHPGYTIDQISNMVDQDFSLRPNVVLLMAGTNDILVNLDLANAPTRLGHLIDKLVTNLPDAAVLVAQLTPLGNPALQGDWNTFNTALLNVVTARADLGRYVMLVDTSRVKTIDLNPDGTHPNDQGYSLLADSWFAGLQSANSDGWIHSPATIPSSTTASLSSMPTSDTAPSSADASVTATSTLSGSSPPVSATKSSLANKLSMIGWNTVTISIATLALGCILL